MGGERIAVFTSADFAERSAGYGRLCGKYGIGEWRISTRKRHSVGLLRGSGFRPEQSLGADRFQCIPNVSSFNHRMKVT